ncbi:cobaltochelatase subunit CobN [Methanolapillus ohkumae]
MIPLSAAEPSTLISGSDDKIDVLYIGNAGYFDMAITTAMHDQMMYKDDFNIQTIEIAYPATADLSPYDLNTFDFIFVDMAYYGIKAEDWSLFEAAHNNGVTLIAFMNDYQGYTPVPDSFDFRDTPELTTSTTYSADSVRIFFEMFADQTSYSAEPVELQYDYAENILMFLAKEKSTLDPKCKAITDDWTAWKSVKIAYLGFSGQEKWVYANPYSSFMDVTFLPDYWKSSENQTIVNFGNSGGFANQNLILLNMIVAASCQGIDDKITNSNYKLENVAKTKPVLIFNTGGLGPEYAEEIDNKNHPLSVDVQLNEQILVLAGREYGSKELDHFTKEWILKSASPTYGIYHPDLPGKTYETLDNYLTDYSVPGQYDPQHHVYNDSNRTVGLWFHKEYFSDGRLPIINAVIADLESKNINVIATYDIFRESDDGSGNPINPTMKYFADSNGKVLIRSAISIKDFSFNYNDYEEGLEWLNELNVTVLKAVTTASADGQISKDSLVYSTVSPNRDGMGDFILIGGPSKDGAIIYDDQIDWLNNRAIAWANLKAKDNADKKIAILYYNYPPGKDGIGANYLNVMRSFAGCETTQFPGLLRQMKDEGYTISFDNLPSSVTESTLNETNLLDLVFRQGINVGAYAPGVLNTMVDEKGNTNDANWWGATMVPIETYQTWFDATITNTTIRQGIIDSWGEPWDYSKPLLKDQSGMIWENNTTGKRFVVIPAIRFGNVWLTPQPDRALATDKAFSYHSGDIPPTHQYVAYYLWLQNEFKPDAIINFGTHGTHEWLPGSPHGMDAKNDLSPLLLGDIPNIYPYIVANVGEGLTAEYRGNALIIDHMTPPMIRSNLDSNADLEWLEKEIQAYFISQAGGDSGTNAQRQNAIVTRMFAAGIDDVIGMDKYKREINENNPNKVTDLQLQGYLKGMSQDDFSKFLKEDLFDYVESVKENSLPYGMHVYGQSPTEDQIGAMLRNMWGHQFDDVIYNAYYKDAGYVSIPYSEEEHIHEMVIELADASTAAEMKNILENYYSLSSYTNEDHESVIRFILGPAMYFEGETDANVVISKWDSITTRTDANGDPVTVMDELRDEIVFAYYFYSAAPATDKLNTSIENVTKYCIDNKGSGKVDAALINKALSVEFKTQSHQNKGIVSYLTGYGRLNYAQNLKDCGDSETTSLLRALSGGYIWPNAGNDPIQNPSALPTGKNFYGIDPDKFPTKPAWEVGKSLADQMIAKYYNDHGKWPDTIAFSRFGVEFIRDEGALEACALYLLGVEPVWDVNGKVDPKSVKVISLNDLKITFYDEKQKKEVTMNRPRIDIVYTTAGMRDAFGDKLKLINVGVKAVATLNEPDEWNYVKKNSDKLIAAGFEDLAYFRCFANEPGNYEIGTGNLVSASGSWDDPQSVVDMYIKNMGFVFGDDSTWGQKAPDFFKALLGSVDATVHADSSNLYDTLDNDDFFQYFGALNMAVKYTRNDGKMPDMFVADTKNVGQNARTNGGKIYTLKEYINIDLESRYMNEEWIRGMMEAGYSGSTMYAEFIENMFGWAVTSDGELISYENWKRAYDIYVNNSLEIEGLDQFMKDNPYAYQSLTSRMLESMRKDYFKADESLKESDPEAYNKQVQALKEMQKMLIEQYMDSVIDHGVACCHHTCGNPSFDKFMAGQLSVLGVDPDKEEAYWKIVQGATERTKPPVNPSPSTSSGGGFGTASVSSGPAAESAASGENPSEGSDTGGGYGTDGSTPGTPQAPVSGYEMTSSIQNAASAVRDFITNPSFSTSSMIAIAIVILLIGAVFFGFKRKGI